MIILTYLYILLHSPQSRLGHGDDRDRTEPTLVTGLGYVGQPLPNGTFSGIDKVSCGLFHMVASTVGTGELYGWGWNTYGQLHSHTHSTTNNNNNNTNNSLDYSSNNSSSSDIYHEPIRLTGFDNLLQTYCGHGSGGDDDSSGSGNGVEGKKEEEECEEGEGGIDEVVCGSRYTAISTHSRQRVLVM